MTEDLNTRGPRWRKALVVLGIIAATLVVAWITAPQVPPEEPPDSYNHSEAENYRQCMNSGGTPFVDGENIPGIDWCEYENGTVVNYTYGQ